MGIHIAYYRTIACMGRRLTLPGLSATRRAVAARRELPDSPAAPHFTGGEPAAPGERIPAEPARSVEGSERHRGRLEAHWAPESSFSRLAPGRVAASGRVPPLHAFAPRAGDGRGKPGPGTMPTDRVDEPQVVPWLEKDDLAYYGPFRCVSRPAPRDGTTHVPHSTRRPLPRFSRAKLALAKDSIPLATRRGDARSKPRRRVNASRSAARLHGHPFRGLRDPNDVGARRRRVSPPSLTQTLSSLLVFARGTGTTCVRS